MLLVQTLQLARNECQALLLWVSGCLYCEFCSDFVNAVCACLCVCYRCADDKSKQLLGQMLALLVGHLDSCATAELAAAVQDLSTLAQQRMDGLHLQRLLSDMEAAHAAVKAAAAATDTQQSSAAAAAGAGRRSSAGLVSGMKGLSIAQADGGLSSTTPARRPLQALQGSATPCGASRSRRVVVPSCTAAAALQQAARGSKARAAVGDAEQQGEASSSIAGPAGPLGAAVAVPPSIARHASRRSRLKGLTSSVPAISEGLTSTSSAGTLRMGADKTAVKPQRKQLTGRQAEAELFGDVRPCTSPAADDVAMPSCSSSSASQQPPPSVPVKGRRGVSSAGLGRIAGQAGTAAAAGADCGQLGSRQAAVILVLGDGLQQLPWESCAGLREVNMCRYVPLLLLSLISVTYASSVACAPCRKPAGSLSDACKGSWRAGTGLHMRHQLQQLGEAGFAQSLLSVPYGMVHHTCVVQLCLLMFASWWSPKDAPRSARKCRTL